VEEEGSGEGRRTWRGRGGGRGREIDEIQFFMMWKMKIGNISAGEKNGIHVLASSHSLVCRRVVTSLRGECSRLPTQKGGPDTQNQRIRPYFL
jgi:hypothetical protein